MKTLFSKRLIAATALVASLLGAELSYAQDDTAMLIRRTIHPDDDAANGFTQKGGVAFTPSSYTRGDAYTIGFWAKRRPSSAAAGLTGGTPKTWSTSGQLGSAGVRRSATGALPDDDEWHYVYGVITGGTNSGSDSWYDEGIHLGGSGLIFLDFLGIGATSFHDSAGALTQKGPTISEMVIDDVSVWSGNSEEVLEIHRQISRHGIGELPADHPNLLGYWDCSTGNTLEYWEDDTILNSSATGNNRRYTGKRISTPPLVSGSDKPRRNVRVTVKSEYGAEMVTPKVSESGDFPFQQSGDAPTVFSAPRAVYLDRYYNELEPTQENIQEKAYYRAVSTGYSVQGGEVDIPGDRSFQELLQTNITVEWLWDLEYAVFVDSATAEIEGLEDSLGDPTLNGDPSRPGKYWFKDGESVTAAIKGIIGDASDPAASARFTSTGYTIENASDDQDRYVQLNGNSYLRAEGATDLQNGDFTVEFWARQEADSGPNYVFTLNNSGMGADNYMRMYLRPTGQIYFTNGTNNVDVNDCCPDEDWHHYALSYDAGATTYSLYRDAEMISTGSRTFEFFGGESGQGATLLIGANATNETNATNTFQGGLNNFRIWESALSAAEVETAMTTAAVGNSADLLEVTFDNPSSPFGNTAVMRDANDILTLSPWQWLNDAYTLEARVKFPLPTTGTGWRTLFFRTDAHMHTTIRDDGELGNMVDGAFYPSGFDVDTLDPGYHMISAVATGESTLTENFNSGTSLHATLFGNAAINNGHLALT